MLLLLLLLKDYMTLRTLRAPSPPPEALTRLAVEDLPCKEAKMMNAIDNGVGPVRNGGDAHGSELANEVAEFA